MIEKIAADIVQRRASKEQVLKELEELRQGLIILKNEMEKLDVFNMRDQEIREQILDWANQISVFATGRRLYENHLRR